MADLRELVNAFHSAYVDMFCQIGQMFPAGSVVRIENNWAIVVGQSNDVFSDKIPLEFENGNIWWKPVLALTRSDDRSLWPSWVVTRKRRAAGFKAAQTRRLNAANSK